METLALTARAAHETCRHKAYALTCDQYEWLLARCGNRCEICDQPGGSTPRDKLHIDHDCKQGMWAVRGLLCAYCNSHPYLPSVVERMPVYLDSAYYVKMLAARGLELGVYPEPTRGSLVYNQDEWRWKRLASGWVRQGTAHHRAQMPITWNKLLYRYGPFNLHLLTKSGPRLAVAQ